MKQGTKLSLENFEKIKELHQKGTSGGVIAQILNISTSTVLRYVRYSKNPNYVHQDVKRIPIYKKNRTISKEIFEEIKELYNSYSCSTRAMAEKVGLSQGTVVRIINYYIKRNIPYEKTFYHYKRNKEFLIDSLSVNSERNEPDQLDLFNHKTETTEITSQDERQNENRWVITTIRIPSDIMSSLKKLENKEVEKGDIKASVSYLIRKAIALFLYNQPNYEKIEETCEHKETNQNEKFEDRISVLEMQLEIILDKLKELENAS